MKTHGVLHLIILAFALAAFLRAEYALGQGLIVYPSKGQSPEQQQQDRNECHTWAVQQTGYDPARAQTAAPPPPQQAPQGGVVRGAGRGAAIGAVGGAITGNAGKGAAMGAAMGGLIGGIRQRGQVQQQQQQQAQVAAQQQAAAAQGRDAYNRAMSACLSSRGYTVK